MGFYSSIHVNSGTVIHIWKITETEHVLSNGIALTERNSIRLSKMRSESHRRGFLAVRQLLMQNGLTDHDLEYDGTGKPFLNESRHISITHSHEFAAVALSDRNIGIDMEMLREKVLVIADKFIEKEYDFLDPSDQPDLTARLTVIWGAKEALFKVRNEIGISYKDHIYLKPFTMQDQKATVVLQFGKETKYQAEFRQIENFILVWIND